MFQDIIRATVQRIFSDKILLGLLIVCLLGFFVGGFNNRQDTPTGKPPEGQPASQAPADQAANVPAESSGQSPGVNSPSTPSSNYLKSGQLQPAVAVDFVKWWMKAAMDYAPQSALQSHEAAANWMSSEAYKAFAEAFWNPQLAQQILSGAAVGSFQPISVQAEAINPDHTIVIGLIGTLILQEGSGRPVANQVQMDILVNKGSTGLRITGINNRLSTVSPSVY